MMLRFGPLPATKEEVDFMLSVDNVTTYLRIKPLREIDFLAVIEQLRALHVQRDGLYFQQGSR